MKAQPRTPTCLRHCSSLRHPGTPETGSLCGTPSSYGLSISPAQLARLQGRGPAQLLPVPQGPPSWGTFSNVALDEPTQVTGGIPSLTGKQAHRVEGLGGGGSAFHVRAAPALRSPEDWARPSPGPGFSLSFPPFPMAGCSQRRPRLSPAPDGDWALVPQGPYKLWDPAQATWPRWPARSQSGRKR